MASRREALDHVLAQDNPQQHAANASLWLNKYLHDQRRPDPDQRGHSRESAGEADAKATHLARTAALGEALDYVRFFARWEQALQHRGATTRRATVQGRVAIGLGGENVIETAITLHHTYGVPYLPGSALKGLAAAFAHQQLADPRWHKGNAQQRIEPGEAHQIMFGSTTQAGYVTFHDALYIPGSGVERRPLHPDVLAVHHPGYYRGESIPPADWDSPVPVPFLTATGSYLLALEGPIAWVAKAYEILGLALAEMGIGAKTSSGYGRLLFEGANQSTGTNVSATAATTTTATGSGMPQIGDLVTGQRGRQIGTYTINGRRLRGVEVAVREGRFTPPPRKRFVFVTEGQQTSGGFRGVVTEIDDSLPGICFVLVTFTKRED